MNIDNSVMAGIISNVWSVESIYESNVPTMLSLTELRMLEWLGRSINFSGSVIVDAGSFLGGSTCAIAEGLLANQANKNVQIHSYDAFLVPKDSYSQALIGRHCTGESVLDIFYRNLGDKVDLIITHQGDFLYSEPPIDSIGCLFIDIAKSWELNDIIIRKFFPSLIPGASIVIQQDMNDHSCPWVNLTMEYYADYFEYLTDDSSSRIYLYKKNIPPELLSVSIRNDISSDDKMNLMEMSCGRSKSEVANYLCKVSKSWLIFEIEDSKNAITYLNQLRNQQPWTGVAYVDMVISAMKQLGNMEGYSNYINDYFG